MTASVDFEQDPMVYQGQFGPFTIEPHDRQEVVVYRVGLAIAALSFTLGTVGILWRGDLPWVVQSISVLYTVFWLALGLSLLKIHIYLRPLHRLLQVLWLIGGVASLAIAHFSPQPFAVTLYEQPQSLWGVGFTFAALTGIYFKEAFCFNRLETKVLTPIVPFLLLGHLFGFLPDPWKVILLAVWAINFAVFALRKVIQPIPPDIGDKSVFDYLEQQRQQASTAS
ncbi:DUF2301 domain-containing membrane protein [Oscillatoria sp. CS-180]|uniref:DUF2301 domain-containing membrane protein n=1 Tax=Oscillatoria sp. CS-180 TaxID=3021720 RepID=UPI00232E42F7|nr:DUF2301 domain-containing membrane protein [Oscillatoria sp. CS-180]MDB9525383.1 DUF2301 domain-containing membrane protein [Oscillatoria sp. CS-180]